VADCLRKLAEDHLRGVVYKYEYGDVISLWIEDGLAFIDSLERADLPKLIPLRVLDDPDGASLLHNLQSLASSWRSSIGSDAH
jgi:hypothetical protein